MKRRLKNLLVVLVLWTTANIGQAEMPVLDLGPKPSFALFQPRVTIEIESEAGGASFGPEANSFLLDTAANGMVIFPPATDQLGANGFQNEGTFEEAGVSGKKIFQVSAPYQLTYAGTDAVPQQMNEVRFMSGDSPVDPTGLMGLDGIVGISGMVGKVTSLDNRTREGAPPLGMGLSFSNELPASNTQRFTVPFNTVEFPIEEGESGPLPTWSQSLPTVTLHSTNNDHSVSNSIVFDTGAQMTIISEAMAGSLGLDANGNGDFGDEAVATVPVSGATGTINAPVLVVDRMSLPTDQGFELSWTDAQVIVLDIDPSISGVLGSDFMTDDGGLDVTFLSGGSGGLGELLGGGDLGSILGDLLGGEGGLGDLLGGDLGGLGGLGDLLGGLDGGLGGLGDLLGGDLGGLGGLGDLLGGGLGGSLGGGDLFAAFPLESYFDRVHVDLRQYPEGAGQVVFDVNPAISATILNGDHVFDVLDVDAMTAAVGSADARFDLDGDGLVAAADRESLIGDVFKTQSGDSDLDGDVDFADFLVLSKNFGESLGWGGGDFDGDGTTSFADFLLQSEHFGSTPSAITSVPEPSSHVLVGVVALATLLGRYRRIGRD